MSLSTKAVIAALALSLSLTPAIASAQGIPITNYGPGIGGAPAIGAPIGGGIPSPMPVQGTDCGASHMQALLGHHVSVAQSRGIPARYFTPHSPYGTMDYQPHRLNISANENFIIDRVYCG